MWASLGIGVSGSLIAAAIYLWVTEGKLVPALVIAGVGIAGFIATWLFKKKNASAPPASVSQSSTQQFNPHVEVNPVFNFGVPPPEAEPKRDSDKHEAAVIEYFKSRENQNIGYDVKELSDAVGISMPDLRDILETLEIRKTIFSLEQLDAFGGKSYFLDYLHRAPVQSPPNLKLNQKIVARRVNDGTQE